MYVVAGGYFFTPGSSLLSLEAKWKPTDIQQSLSLMFLKHKGSFLLVQLIPYLTVYFSTIF
jgi:hypothetical protein